jgi:hypothetical protein
MSSSVVELNAFTPPGRERLQERVHFDLRVALKVDSCWTDHPNAYVRTPYPRLASPVAASPVHSLSRRHSSGVSITTSWATNGRGNPAAARTLAPIPPSRIAVRPPGGWK